MKYLGWVVALGLLAGCGADGDPIKPSLGLGLRITPDGVRPDASLGVASGPVRLRVGL